jgi:hypothetical protein
VRGAISRTKTTEIKQLSAGILYIITVSESPRKSMTGARTKTKVLTLRLKDKHAKFLQDLAGEVNFVWNYCNELQITMFNRERRFLSGYDFAKFTRGARRRH